MCATMFKLITSRLSDHHMKFNSNVLFCWAGMGLVLKKRDKWLATKFWHLAHSKLYANCQSHTIEKSAVFLQTKNLVSQLSEVCKISNLINSAKCCIVYVFAGPDKFQFVRMKILFCFSFSSISSSFPPSVFDFLLVGVHRSSLTCFCIFFYFFSVLWVREAVKFSLIPLDPLKETTSTTLKKQQHRCWN